MKSSRASSITKAAVSGLLILSCAAPGCSDSSPGSEGEPGAETLSGTLQIIRVDFVDGRSEEKYDLVTERGRIRLRLTSPSSIDGLASGTAVRVRGGWIGEGDSTFTARGFEAEKRALAQPLEIAKVSRKTAIVLSNFSNNPSEQPIGKDAARAAIFTDASSANAFWKEASFGNTEFVGKVSSTGDVFGYYTLDATNDDCAGNFQSWSDKALAKAQAAGADLSGYDHIMFMFAAQCPAAWGVVGGTNTWFGSNFWREAAPHELGHNLGLNHASAYACTDDAGNWVSISTRCDHEGAYEYGDNFDVMGRRVIHPSVWSKARLGLLQPSSIVTVTRTGTYSLAPAYKTDGVQTLRILKGTINGVPRYYYLEYRRPYGVFDAFSSTDPVVNGVTVRLAQDHTQGNQKPWLVDTTPATQKPDGTRNFDDATLAVGQTFYDSVADIRITVNGISATGADVLIDLDKTTDPPGDGTGVTGAYYDNADLTSLKVTRTDPRIDFDWGTGSPDATIAPTTYSVRWLGYVLPQSTGVHTFYTTTNDGVRLTVGKTRIIDNWVVGGVRQNSGQVTLNKGQKYLVRMEYFQDQGGAVAKLEWATPFSARAVIPTSQLFPF